MTNRLADVEISKRRPIIGVVGATTPSFGYESKMGISVGYALRAYMEEKGGNIFTGGVEGVGVDVYVGVVKFCIDNAIKTGVMPENKFFVLIPEFIRIGRGSDRFLVPYYAPYVYSALSNLSSNGKLDIVVRGKNMEERRKYVAELSDTLIAINGGSGTLDEILNMLERSKPVIALKKSGGAASILSAFKHNKLQDVMKLITSDMDVSALTKVDKNLIKTVENADEMVKVLFETL